MAKIWCGESCPGIGFQGHHMGALQPDRWQMTHQGSPLKTSTLGVSGDLFQHPELPERLQPKPYSLYRWINVTERLSKDGQC